MLQGVYIYNWVMQEYLALYVVLFLVTIVKYILKVYSYTSSDHLGFELFDYLQFMYYCH
jgi:hypothetical protein